MLVIPEKPVEELSAEELTREEEKGFKRVTRDELFDLRPDLKRIYERLEKRLGEQGSA